MQDHPDEQLAAVGVPVLVRRVTRPLTIIFGQLFFVALAIGFLSAIHIKGYILPPGGFEYNTEDPTHTYVVTLVSHILAVASSYLFSQAVLYLIQVYLADPMPRALIGIWISLSKRSLIFERRKAVWVLTCAAIFFASANLSSCWNGLLTPKGIVIHTPLGGREIDLSSAVVFNDTHLFHEIWTGSNGMQTWLQSFRSVSSVSGAVSADVDIGHISALDFGNWTYFGTTGGILPVDYVYGDVSHPTWLVTSNSTPSIPPIASPYYGDRIITMSSQQGLVANVTCKHQHLGKNTHPPLTRNATRVTALNGKTYNVVSIVSVGCSVDGERVHTDMITHTNDTIGALVCSSSKKNSFIVLIDLSGKYGSGPMVCTVTPQTMQTDVVYDLDAQVVSYAYDYNEADEDEDEDDEDDEDDGDGLAWKLEPALPWVSFALMSVIQDTFDYAQNAGGNVIGDTLLVDLNGKSVGSRATLRLMESYLRGVVSFTGTAMKFRLASKNGIYPQSGPPSELLRNITGRLETPCIGWTRAQNVGKRYGMLIPIFLVAFASIAIVVFAECKSGFKGIPAEHARFNPANPLHLMSAASAGGMHDAFSGLSEENINAGKDKNLRLAYVGERMGLRVCDGNIL